MFLIVSNPSLLITLFLCQRCTGMANTHVICVRGDASVFFSRSITVTCHRTYTGQRLIYFVFASGVFCNHTNVSIALNLVSACRFLMPRWLLWLSMLHFYLPTLCIISFRIFIYSYLK